MLLLVSGPYAVLCCPLAMKIFYEHIHVWCFQIIELTSYFENRPLAGCTSTSQPVLVTHRTQQASIRAAIVKEIGAPVTKRGQTPLSGGQALIQKFFIIRGADDSAVGAAFIENIRASLLLTRRGISSQPLFIVRRTEQTLFHTDQLGSVTLIQ